MRKCLCILLVYFAIVTAAQAGELVLKGTYNGKNLFVQNPYLIEQNTFCTQKVLVNDREVFDNPKVSAFSIDLSYLNIGDLVVVRIIYHDGCEPRVVNPLVLARSATEFEFVNAQADNNSLEWSTKGEQIGGGFVIERLHLKKGWLVYDSLIGKGDANYNQYSINPAHYPGENKYRIKYADRQGKEYYSLQFAFTSTDDPITFTPTTNVTSKITLSKPTEYSITDMNGNEIRKGNGKVIMVQDLHAGLYFLNIENRAERFIKK